MSDTPITDALAYVITPAESVGDFANFHIQKYKKQSRIFERELDALRAENEEQKLLLDECEKAFTNLYRAAQKQSLQDGYESTMDAAGTVLAKLKNRKGGGV